MPYLRTLSSFRDGVRRVAIAKGDGALKEILALSDRLRDTDLVPLGVALDDQEGTLRCQLARYKLLNAKYTFLRFRWESPGEACASSGVDQSP